MKTLVLAEKPSVARDIARVLRCQNKQQGYIEGSQYIVTWALGHLVTLADPEQYNLRYKSWRLEDLPILPDDVELEVIKETKKQYQSVKMQMYRKDVKEIVIATDAGREGELVARWILEKANVRKPIKRLWISSVTDRAIRDGFNQLKDGRLYNDLYASAQARAEADWFVGINATRALTCKFNAQLSCGRVQTPTLALIAKREEEISQFKPKEYYGIIAKTDDAEFSWIDSMTNDTKTFNKDKSDEVLKRIKNKNGKIQHVKKQAKKSYPKGLYDLTELQRDANRRYQFSAKETLQIMQSLYERHKVLTYPRTDSKYISTDIIDTLKDRIKACQHLPYAPFVRQILNEPIKTSKSFVDNSKVSDHHAIIPTEERINLSQLNDRERKVYDLVVKRFLAVFLPPYEYNQITIELDINEERFVAKGKQVLSKGFKILYDTHYEDEEDEDVREQVLPDYKENQIITITQYKQTTGLTKPQAYFNEASLLSVMENPVKYMDTNNKNLIKTIGETGGLGTVATRADIIEKLFNIFLIEKRGQHLHITSKGKQLLDLVPEDLKSPLLTAKWEQNLSQIAKGTLSKDAFLKNMREYAVKIVQEIKKSEDKFKHDNMTTKTCPECGKFLLEVKSKDSTLLVCQDRTCRYRKVQSKVTNARCPNCKKKLELFGEGDKQIFICKCGHREKLSTFNERKSKENKNISKREVSKYLEKQNKESDVTINSALADALKQLKK